MHKNIVFIDNVKDFWYGDMDFYSKSIDYVPVSNSSRNIEQKYTNDLAKIGNQYAVRLLDFGSSNFINKGLDQKIANKLKKWSESSNTNKFALFDWDGTISASEGFSIEVFRPKVEFTNPMMDFLRPSFFTSSYVGSPSYVGGGSNKSKKKTQKRKRRTLRRRQQKNDPLQTMIESPEYINALSQPLIIPPKEFLDDMFVYIMKPERVDMLRDLFRTLRDNGVKIHILTHNPYASTANPYRKIFIEMMWRLFNWNTSSSHREELDQMLHSTVDYTDPGEPFLKRNIIGNRNISKLSSFRKDAKDNAPASTSRYDLDGTNAMFPQNIFQLLRNTPRIKRIEYRA